jgi:hypothetical protein
MGRALHRMARQRLAEVVLAGDQLGIGDPGATPLVRTPWGV